MHSLHSFVGWQTQLHRGLHVALQHNHHIFTIFNTALYHTETASCSCLLLLLSTCRPAREHSAQRAASQKALSRLQILCSPLLGGIIGAELLFSSSLPLDSQCPSQRESEAFAVRLFNSYSAHTSTNFQIFTTPTCMGEFQEIKESLSPFCFFVFLEHRRLNKHSQAFLYYGTVLYIEKKKGIFLSIFILQTHWIISNWSFTDSFKQKLFPLSLKFQPGKLEIGQTLINWKERENQAGIGVGLAPMAPLLSHTSSPSAPEVSGTFSWISNSLTQSSWTQSNCSQLALNLKT